MLSSPQKSSRTSTRDLADTSRVSPHRHDMPSRPRRRSKSHSDLLVDEPQSEPSPDLPCCRPPPPALPSLLPRSIHSLSYPTGPSDSLLIHHLPLDFALLRAPWLASLRSPFVLVSPRPSQSSTCPAFSIPTLGLGYP